MPGISAKSLLLDDSLIGTSNQTLTINGAPLALADASNLTGRLPLAANGQVNLVVNATQSIDGRIAGLTASDSTKLVYSLQNHASAIYTRSTTCWAANIDLTPLSPWNSDLANQKAGTLISPRHVVFASHFPIANGNTMRFVTKDNMVVTRTLTNQIDLGSDIVVGVLDSDVPSSISFVKLLPTDAPTYFDLTGVPVLYTDQEEKASVYEIRYDSGGNQSLRIPLDAQRLSFYELVVGGDSGDPVCLVIDNKLVMVEHFTGVLGGPEYRLFASAINTAMTTLGGNYQVTIIDIPRVQPAWTDVRNTPAITSLLANQSPAIGQIPIVKSDGFLDSSIIKPVVINSNLQEIVVNGTISRLRLCPPLGSRVRELDSHRLFELIQYPATVPGNWIEHTLAKTLANTVQNKKGQFIINHHGQFVTTKVSLRNSRGELIYSKNGNSILAKS